MANEEGTPITETTTRKRTRAKKGPLGAADPVPAAEPKKKRSRARVSALVASVPGEAKAPRARKKKATAPAAEAPAPAAVEAAPAPAATEVPAAQNDTTTVAAAPGITVAAEPQTVTAAEVTAARAAAEGARKNPDKPLMGEWHGVRWERQLYVGAAVGVLLRTHTKVTAKEMAQVIPESVMPYRELCWVMDDLHKAAKEPGNKLKKIGRATYCSAAA